LVGQNDEVSFADKFPDVFKEAGKDIRVTILPGVDHISMILNPVAIQAAVNAVEDMDHERPNQAMQPTRHFVVSSRPIRAPVFKVLGGLSLSR
jgi:hypothetical protein